MPDLRQVLERTAETVSPAPDALERVQRRHDRRSGNRRLSAVAVAMVVAGAGLGLTALLLTGRTDRPDLPRPGAIQRTLAPGEVAAGQFVEAFMRARIDGEGAEAFLSSRAQRQYDRHESEQLYLYQTDPADVRYEEFEILSIRPMALDGYLVTIEIRGRFQRNITFEFQEVLTVGPGEDQETQARELLVLAASGGQGP